MDNQHRKIKGYRELSQEEIDLMNEIKEQGAALEDLVERLDKAQFANSSGQVSPSTEALRWVRIGKTLLQLGTMALTRAVAKPEFF